MSARSPVLVALAVVGAALVPGCGGGGADEEEEEKPLSRVRCSDLSPEGELAEGEEHWSSLSPRQKRDLANVYQVGRGAINAASPKRVLAIPEFDDGRLATVVDRYYERGARCDLANAFAAADRKLIFTKLRPKEP
jgi:hypothetical protein